MTPAPRTDPTQPSRTALLAAGSRALHLFHHGQDALLQDWLAWPLMGPFADELLPLGKALLGDAADPFTTWIAARSRLSDDWLNRVAATQHVVLGAGLDSSAWRSVGIRVFEVDHPATQEWKRARVESFELRGGPVWIPVDFERQRLGDALADAGIQDDGDPIFISWQGVVPYLTTEALTATLRELPPRSSLAISYVLPERAWNDRVRSIGTTIQALAADAGEPWKSLMTSDEISHLLAEAGFAVVEDVGPEDIAHRYGLPALNYERMALAERL